MECLLDQKLVDCIVLEDMGYQGGQHAKVIEYKGREVVVVKAGDRWIRHRSELYDRDLITGQQK